VAYGNGVFVAVGGSAANPQGLAVYSFDGRTWDVASLPTSARWISVKWGNGVFVALTDGGVAATSPDGVNWTARGSIGSTVVTVMAFGGGKFIALRGTSTLCYSSPDGITWTARNLPASVDWGSLAYGGGTWVAIGTNTTSVATSPDGITWTSRVLPGATIASTDIVGYAFGQFFAGANGTTGFTFYTSPDGITWAGKTIANNTSGSVSGVFYGDGTLVIGISSSTYPGYSIISNDGVTFRLKKLGAFTVATGYGGGYGAGLFISLGTSNSVAVSLESYENSPTPSDYMYLSGAAGQFVRVK
jgi:hypothetical protein